MRNISKTILRDAGFKNIDEADDGINALKKLDTGNHDIIMCDWTMPNMSGLELLEQVRKSKDLQHLPFLMVTAVADTENVKKAIQAGVTDYISKPFQSETLCQKLITAYTSALKSRNS